MKHTKGPWKARIIPSDSYDYRNSYWVDQTDGRGIRLSKPIADIRRYDDIESQANAKLIAAAPDLLEACQFVRQAYLDNNKDGLADFSECMTRIKSAIHKATEG